MASNRICRICKKKISESTYGTFRGKFYHMEEFTCGVCKEGLEGKEAAEDEVSGILYCTGCHHEKIMAKCEACKAAVIGTSIEALGKFYHPHHFLCYRCKKLLDGNYFKNEDQPVCQECFETRKKGSMNPLRNLRDLRTVDRRKAIRLRDSHFPLRLLQVRGLRRPHRQA